MSAAKKIWNTSWRVAVGLALLVWIFHSIFVNEARLQAKRGELIDEGTKVIWTDASAPPRTEQWRLGWKHGPPALWKTLRSVNVTSLGFSFAIMGATLLIGIARWRMVLRVQGLNLSLNRAAEISLVAHFFNAFLLGTAGGDVMKAYYAARETHHKKTEAVVTVLVDRVIGLWAMLFFATIMIAPNYKLFQQSGLRTAAALIALLTIAASGFVFVAFRGGVSKQWAGARAWLRRLPKGEWLERLLDACREFGKAKGFLLQALLLSMLLNLLCVLQFYVLGRGLPGAGISFLTLCFVVPTVICIAALPVTPAGLGLRENVLVQLLAAGAIGVAATPALSLSLLAYAGSLFWSLVGGGVYMMFKRKHHLAEEELTGEEARS